MEGAATDNLWLRALWKAKGRNAVAARKAGWGANWDQGADELTGRLRNIGAGRRQVLVSRLLPIREEDDDGSSPWGSDKATHVGSDAASNH